MNNFEEKLDRYADLTVKKAANVQKDQIVFIISTIETAPFTRKLVKKAYEAGAKQVFVEWSDEEINRTKYLLAPDEAFTEFPSWMAASRNEMVERGATFITIVSQDPDLLNGIDSNRIANFQKAAGKALNNLREAMQSNKISWTVVAAAGEGWSKKIFPGQENSLDLLWDAIFSSVRVDQENVIQAWEEHLDTLISKADYLNNKKYKYIHYKAPGTDLRIELSEKHKWCAAGAKDSTGKEFVANMPTEEVFTIPLKNGVNGTVSSTKPLAYGGNVIDEFTLTFEEGRIVNAVTKKGNKILNHLINVDEGAKYLGEIALVPHHSPISESNILFYNTLFDENASNHLAIGAGYPFCLEGGEEMNIEQLHKYGVNISQVHEDFMIGSADMDIDGELPDGTREAIFRNGNWAF
ncbi:aminopeptidase [Pradoshia sp. D12]|uniref:aminopeptidase n=1 Tax=Bacillaceae TaxID=186817 RepID=UPI00112AA6CF|nr:MULTISPECIES: aminopeptidase [Bacillaceae]QFK71111.1 aminopeptidase [Pradoshia sp. D12]TPF72903.1 aminopeptidase [Bacillus sp. D12]